MMNKTALCILALLLSACSTPGGTIAPPDSRTPQKVHIDERLLQECRPLSDLIPNPRPSDVLEQHGRDVLLYKDCAESKTKLIETVRQAFGK